MRPADLPNASNSEGEQGAAASDPRRVGSVARGVCEVLETGAVGSVLYGFRAGRRAETAVREGGD